MEQVLSLWELFALLPLNYIPLTHMYDHLHQRTLHHRDEEDDTTKSCVVTQSSHSNKIHSREDEGSKIGVIFWTFTSHY